MALIIKLTQKEQVLKVHDINCNLHCLQVSMLLCSLILSLPLFLIGWMKANKKLFRIITLNPPLYCTHIKHKKVTLYAFSLADI